MRPRLFIRIEALRIIISCCRTFQITLRHRAGELCCFSEACRVTRKRGMCIRLAASFGAGGERVEGASLDWVNILDFTPLEKRKNIARTRRGCSRGARGL